MRSIDQIRGDFPILERRVYNKPLTYLDSGATAQKPQCVIERVNQLHSELNANIHRGVHFLSQEVTSLYEQARESVRRFIGAEHREEIIFTAGATAAINTVAYSWGESNLKEGDNIIISEMEHHSNIVPWQLIADRRGAQIRVLPFDDEGRLMVEALDELMDERTRLVAVTQASNTLGTRPDIKAIATKCRAMGVVTMVDGCQGVVHGGVDVVDLGCDFYAFSGHKLYGPTGIGVLYGRREILEAIPPFLAGGDMVDRVSFQKTTYAPLPLRFEAGTANYIGAIGLCEAIRYVEQFDATEVEAYEQMLLREMSDRLSKVDGLRIYGTQPDKCGIVSFNVEGVHAYDLGMILDKLGVAIRTGQHCAEPTMAHFGVKGMCRASLGMYNTMADVEALIAGVDRAVMMLR
ncbi:MAG: SufS family cysteine desulfurase [Rikenellaceae bacterium]